jgi:glutamate-1-semialdehyde 2,1-aminomutase
MVGNAPRSGIAFLDEKGQESYELKSLFMQETVRRGILFGGPVFVTWAHSEQDINRTVDACEAAFRVLRKALEAGSVKPFLQGEVVGVVFRPRN